MKILNGTTSSNYEDEYINSFDNLKLHAYKILNPQPTNKGLVSNVMK